MAETKKLKKETSRRNASKKAERTHQKNDEQAKNFREYQKNYINNTYRQFSIKLRGDMDADVIAYLDDSEKVPNLTNLIRRMILTEIYKDDPREKDSNGRPYEVINEFQKIKHENALMTKQKYGKGL